MTINTVLHRPLASNIRLDLVFRGTRHHHFLRSATAVRGAAEIWTESEREGWAAQLGESGVRCLFILTQRQMSGGIEQ